MKDITDEDIIKASRAPSATKAAALLGIHYTTYRRHAYRLGVWKTNQSGKGLSKDRSKYSIPLESILKGNEPQYQTFKLKNRLLKENIIERKCSMCNGTVWMNRPIPLELDHIDGNKYNHKLDNLRLLCPNCHTTTDTYRGKNKRV